MLILTVKESRKGRLPMRSGVGKTVGGNELDGHRQVEGWPCCLRVQCAPSQRGGGSGIFRVG